jgi:transcriptional regulator with XRE-family HTH domain
MNRKRSFEEIFRSRANKVKNRLSKDRGRKITYTELSGKCALDEETLGRIFNGSQKNITLDQAILIAEALGTTLNYLVNYTNSQMMMKNIVKTYSGLEATLENCEKQKKQLEKIERQLSETVDFFKGVIDSVDTLKEH